MTPDNPLRARGMVVHYLRLRLHEPDAEVTARFTARTSTQRTRRLTRAGWRATIGGLLWEYGTNGTHRWIDLTAPHDDDRPDLDPAVYRTLCSAMRSLGGCDEWRVAQLDVAFDYACEADGLVWYRPGSIGRDMNRSFEDEGPSFRLGSKEGRLVRTYWRGFKGDDVTRIEIVLRWNRAERPRIAELGALPNPLRRFTVRPLVGEMTDAERWYLLGLQHYGSRRPAYPDPWEPPGLTKTGRWKRAERMRLLVTDPEALALVEQPRDIFDRDWPALGGDLARQLLASHRDS